MFIILILQEALMIHALQVNSSHNGLEAYMKILLKISDVKRCIAKYYEKQYNSDFNSSTTLKIGIDELKFYEIEQHLTNPET